MCTIAPNKPLQHIKPTGVKGGWLLALTALGPPDAATTTWPNAAQQHLKINRQWRLSHYVQRN